MAKLCTTIREQAFNLGIVMPVIPEYIIDNLKHNLFDWQKDAVINFLINEEIRKQENRSKAPNHLMFNMATGSGKTMIMAALILYYYQQGRRHFIFFATRNNIIVKTENNFINSQHNKYLFNDKIILDNAFIPIKAVDNFSDNPRGIEINFTTIQQLHNDIHLQKENQTTLDDLHKKDIVMLADEAHHLNAITQEEMEIVEKLTSKSDKTVVEKIGWEHTVIKLILNKNGQIGNNRNVLLEFTATIPENEAVTQKYKNKTISEFTLKNFLSEGYTKEISLLSSSLEKKERILLALTINWYRHAIALDYGISNFKPVILFRSKIISNSKKDYKFFLNMIDVLEASDFNFLNTISDSIPPTIDDMYINTEAVVERLLHYIKDKPISDIVDFIKRNFKESNVIITNSKDNTTTGYGKFIVDQEYQLNSLEDKDNHIRAIFTVKRLTEGWDVLNLFDIVRLYEGQNGGGSRKGKTRETPAATIEEKQLIGRGVRYYPFTYEDTIKNKRKFDQNSTHELRILEELFYYTDSDSRYIYEIKSELRKEGYISDGKRRIKSGVKDEVKDTTFYKNTLLWKNEQEDNPNYQKKALAEIKEKFYFECHIKPLAITEELVVLDECMDNQGHAIERLKTNSDKLNFVEIKFSEIEYNIFRKAVAMLARQNNSVFEFKNLKGKLNIQSIDDLQNDNFFGNNKLHIFFPKSMNFSDISGQYKYSMVAKFLKKIVREIEEIVTPKIGSKKFISASLEEEFGAKPKEKIVKEDKINTEIPKNDWYVLDTYIDNEEEDNFLKYFKKYFESLNRKYEDIYLLRNEEVFKIYDFEKGRGFQPDFLLFLTSKEEKLSYQIFIEPKGNDRKTSDDQVWKQEFLEQLTEIYGFENRIEAEFPEYRLVGFPFYNKRDIEENGDANLFDKNFQRLLC